MGWLDKLLGRDKETPPSLDDAEGAMDSAGEMGGDAEDAAEDMTHGEAPSADEAGEQGGDEL